MSLWLVAACGGTLTGASQPAQAVAASTAVTPTPVAPTPRVDGAWWAVTAGGRHLVLNIERCDGVRGRLDSIDEGAKLPIDLLSVDSASMHFEIHRLSGFTFDGTLDPARTQVQGTWKAGGKSQPLTFTKGPPPAPPTMDEPPQRPLDLNVDVVVPEPPSVFRTNGRGQLVYELHVTNFDDRPVTLQRIDVESHGASLAHLEGPDLASAIDRPGAPELDGSQRLEIGPGLVAVVYLWVMLDSDATPSSLDHRIKLATASRSGGLRVANVSVPVRAGAPPVIGPPLHGVWHTANGPSNDSGHRRSIFPVGGRARIAQRFAIDWIKVGDDGKDFRGDRTRNENFLAYGAEALAVADGVVTEARDGIPQNVPDSDPVVPINLDTIGGNHVIVDLGRGRFALWAHLQPGSLRVKVGDHVKRGQVIGLVGNSGQSSAPHLHFQVTDGSSVVGAEGLPYVFDEYELHAPGKAPVTRKKELPSVDETVSFP